jgi:hypothetical protein
MEAGMEVEYNSNVVPSNGQISERLMITPPIDEDFWMMRVRLSEKQAVVCFPKFGTIGIGFQKEEDWNTKLPHTCDAREIFEHISCNKGDKSISDESCISAIQMLQVAIRELAA